MQQILYIVNYFLISRIDYCNSLLTGVPHYAVDRLQCVMNAAARMLCGAGKYSHVTGLTCDRLHWLPISLASAQDISAPNYGAEVSGQFGSGVEVSYGQFSTSAQQHQ